MNGYEQIAQALISTMLSPRQIEVDEMQPTGQQNMQQFAAALASPVDTSFGAGVNLQELVDAFTQ